IIDMYLERIEEAYKHGDITKSNYDVKRRVTAKWVANAVPTRIAT
ncbi:MAG: hypothetical protein JKY55_00225, partial [Aliivibrio sp.]|nr:hypothetical protein [Aliivibrio sp.]